MFFSGSKQQQVPTNGAIFESDTSRLNQKMLLLEKAIKEKELQKKQLPSSRKGVLRSANN